MRRSAVVLARVLGFINTIELMSGSKTAVPELVRQLTERYQFQKYPKTFEELDVAKGIEFLEGAAGECPIKKFVIWPSVVVLETRVSTYASKEVLEGIFAWAAKELDLQYTPGSIKRFAYVSDVSFFSDVAILDVNPAVRTLASKCGEAVSRIWQEPVKYEPLSIRVGHDPVARTSWGIAPFLIEHRADTKFDENKYFSEAPLPTDLHWKILEEFELDMQFTRKAGNA